MKWILIVAAGLVLLVGLVVLVGLFLPREHRATTRVRLRAEPSAVFALLSDVERFPSWRSDVKSVRRIEPLGGRPAFVEDSKHGKITYAVEASEPPRRLVQRIADDSLPYGGTWTFALAPDGETGTLLAITEDGFIRPALFRTLARFVFGYHATMESYLADLGQALGETVTPERVE
jgi:uncharacterized protein YndB with AHSA1/START domain